MQLILRMVWAAWHQLKSLQTKAKEKLLFKVQGNRVMIGILKKEGLFDVKKDVTSRSNI